MIDGQMNLFNEAEALSEEAENALEPSVDEVLLQQRLRERQKNVKPLVEKYFMWVKDVLDSQLPKGATASDLNQQTLNSYDDSRIKIISYEKEGGQNYIKLYQYCE